METYCHHYSAFLLEMLAATWAIQHFQVYLRGRHFFLHSDHKPLEKLGSVHTKTLNRLQLLMNEFDFTICHIPGIVMPSDYLSRHSICALDPYESNEFATTLKSSQDLDPFISALKSFVCQKSVPNNTDQAKVLRQLAPSVLVQNDIVYKQVKDPIDQTSRPLFLALRNMQTDILRNAHSSLIGGHLGEEKTLGRVQLHFWWPGIVNDVALFVKTCAICQANKTGKVQSKVPLHPLLQTSTFNERINMDLFGPLTSDTVNKQILVMMDAFSKYVEIVALPDKEAFTVASAAFNRWIMGSSHHCYRRR